MMNYEERPLHFQCQGSSLLAIFSTPKEFDKRGVLIIVGGPQYRSGSHRQFTLLARQFASNGIAVMRFDYRGMGDSGGDTRKFTSVDDDIRAAVDCFFREVPELNEVVLLGLCDAASAAVFYAYQDSRVDGLVLFNPWVRTEQGAAKAYLKHYYLARLFDRQLWYKIITGKFALLAALRSFLQQITTLIFKEENVPTNVKSDPTDIDLPKKVEADLRRFKGRSLFILCTNDLTAQEFSDLAKSTIAWKQLMSSPKVSRFDLVGANHTFSQRVWREQIGQWTIEWIKKQ